MRDSALEPGHYTDGEIECLDAARSMLTDEEFRGACKFAALQYLWRERLKNGDEDLEKATFYTRLASGDDPRLDLLRRPPAARRPRSRPRERC